MNAKKQKGYRFPQKMLEWIEEKSEHTGEPQVQIMTTAVELLAEINYDAVVTMAQEWGLQRGQLLNVAIWYLSRLNKDERGFVISEFYGYLAGLSEIDERSVPEQKEEGKKNAKRPRGKKSQE